MNFRSLGFLAALAAVLCIGSTAGAAIATYQEGANDPFTGSPYEGVDDNNIIWLSHTAGDYQLGQHELRNYGKSPSLSTGFGGDETTSPIRTYKYKSLFRFDLTSLSGEYASIESVTLRLYVREGDVDHANSLQLFRFTAANGDWLEGTSPNGFPYPPTHNASCWEYRQYSSSPSVQIPWDSGTPGTDLTDYESGTIAATAFDSAATGWVDLEFTDLSFIGSWAAGDNPGMALRVEDESKYSRLSFHSSEYADDAGLRPQLVIDYTPGTGPPPIPGDANLDDIVNDADASILAAHWQQTGMEWGDGDFNADNIVNDADASILAAHWQESQESAAPVPEPSTLVLLAFAAVSLLVWRRK